MLQLSKIDDIAITAAEVRDVNPLSEVFVVVDFKIYGEKNLEIMEFADSGALMLKEEFIG